MCLRRKESTQLPGIVLDVLQTVLGFVLHLLGLKTLDHTQVPVEIIIVLHYRSHT
jgi:hypothetical protein